VATRKKQTFPEGTLNDMIRNYIKASMLVNPKALKKKLILET